MYMHNNVTELSDLFGISKGGKGKMHCCKWRSCTCGVVCPDLHVPLQITRINIECMVYPMVHM